MIYKQTLEPTPPLINNPLAPRWGFGDALTLAPEAIADWITFALVLQLNRRLNLLNVIVKGVLQKSLRSQAVERKVLASQLVPNEILEVMNNSTKGRRVEEHDKAQKKRVA